MSLIELVVYLCYRIDKLEGEVEIPLLFVVISLSFMTPIGYLKNCENCGIIAETVENWNNCGNVVADRRSMSWMHFDRHRYRISY